MNRQNFYSDPNEKDNPKGLLPFNSLKPAKRKANSNQTNKKAVNTSKSKSESKNFPNQTPLEDRNNHFNFFP